MASFATACRLSSRLARRTVTADVAARGFRTSASALAAQNFTMPALSPTMTAGNISSWRIKEGEKFSAGDVLLEIETDKATMDVEAQDDGILMKIIQGDGSKGVSVGTRIGVLAEDGDDIGSLEIPPDDHPKSPSPATEASQKPAHAESTRKPAASDSQKALTPRRAGAKAPKQTKPLMPSVHQLMKENGLDESTVGDMTPTGPQGRLLKGDVLAYLGKIKASSPTGVADRFNKNAHLDLSNIKMAAPKSGKPTKAEAATLPPKAVTALVEMAVSLAEVAKVQAKLQDTHGVFPPLSTFVSRASEFANRDLPLAPGAEPSADALFNYVLGLEKAATTAKGTYVPQCSALAPPSPPGPPSASRKRRLDIIDVLTGSTPSPSPAPKAAATPLLPGALITGPHVFSLVVREPEKRLARVFLQRFKKVLETEPGRLVP